MQFTCWRGSIRPPGPTQYTKQVFPLAIDYNLCSALGYRVDRGARLLAVVVGPSIPRCVHLRKAGRERELSVAGADGRVRIRFN